MPAVSTEFTSRSIWVSLPFNPDRGEDLDPCLALQDLRPQGGAGLEGSREADEIGADEVNLAP